MVVAFWVSWIGLNVGGASSTGGGGWNAGGASSTGGGGWNAGGPSSKRYIS